MDRRNQIVSELMGKMVHVVVDRPIGYQHGDIVYPVNYGYIPGVLAGDGEEQDAYILGVAEPLASFDGQVVGAIRRKNDCEDKLVVAPVGMVYHQGQIAEAVHFQERFFETTVDSLLRRSCGVIPFRWNRDQKEYLIVLQTNHCWSFPKGHMEAGEREEQTALRELWEETGLEVNLIPGKRVTSEYDIPPYTRKQVVLFLGVVQGNVKLQESEIVRCQWVAADALKNYLHPDTYEVCKELLE
jgi:8-oxo-dGTP pyrophosphatase MutT (NUDIX family)